MDSIPLFMSKDVEEKLKTKHDVVPREVQECFNNRLRTYLEDTKEDHKTNPPTWWFVGETDLERELKVCFIYRKGVGYEIKTAYEPNGQEREVYLRVSKPRETG